jgi:hypothetical protein
MDLSGSRPRTTAEISAAVKAKQRPVHHLTDLEVYFKTAEFVGLEGCGVPRGGELAGAVPRALGVHQPGRGDDQKAQGLDHGCVAGPETRGDVRGVRGGGGEVHGGDGVPETQNQRRGEGVYGGGAAGAPGGQAAAGRRRRRRDGDDAEKSA